MSILPRAVKAQRLKFLNSAFNNYINDLRVYEEQFEEGIQLCEKVREFLKEQKEFIIASTHYGEAMEINDDLNGNPYINIVLLIEYHLLPFQDLLEIIEKALVSYATQLKIQIDTIVRTKFSVRFSFTTEIKVEIFPGDIKMTPEQVFENNGKNQTFKKFYNSSLLEPCHDILNEQDEFTQRVAKLTRFWLKTIDFANSKVADVGICSDLLTIASVITARRNGRRKPIPIFNAFHGVITLCERFDKQRMQFFKPKPRYWSTRMGTSQNIPYLFDESNFGTNYMEKIENHVIEIIKWNASIMRRRLNDLRRTNEVDSTINFEKLFETSPLRCPYIITHLNSQKMKSK